MSSTDDSRDEKAAGAAEPVAASGAGGVIEQPTEAPPSQDDSLPSSRQYDKIRPIGVAAVASGELMPAEEAEAERGAADLEALARAPSGPRHSIFSERMKKFIVFMTAWGGFFSPLSANIYFPALNTLAADFKVSNSLINLTLTSYMIFQGLSPTIFGDLADMAGRRPAYFIGFTIYMGANIGLALVDNYAGLLILRCMQSTGSSGTIALGNGVVADIATSAERGIYMGLATSGAMIGPALGPVLGGILAEFLGWRSIFWFLTIMTGVYLIPFLISFPETGRNVVGNGSIPPQGWNMSLLNHLENRRINNSDELSRTVSRQELKLAQAALTNKRKLRVPNPLKTVHIMLEKDVGLILLYNGLIYTAFYDVTASLPSQFAAIYGFNDLQIGLSFIPFGVSCCISTIVCGKLMDWNYKRVAKQAGITVDRKRGDDMKSFPLEKARIQVAFPLLYFGIAAILCYGWVLEQNAPLVAPLIVQFFIGLCLTGAFQVMSVMLVDLYPTSPATATAANNLVRCLLGAAGTAVIIQMIDTMGRGWCFTFIAAVIFFSSPILWVEMKWGSTWREARRVRIQKQKEEKEEEKQAQLAEAEAQGRDSMPSRGAKTEKTN
ncbi:hypothetical protein MMC08_004380 [Hypocenomyce scalaris]|nr:hypothetical protein [Hypocenomyce scalaris]